MEYHINNDNNIKKITAISRVTTNLSIKGIWKFSNIYIFFYILKNCSNNAALYPPYNKKTGIFKSIIRTIVQIYLLVIFAWLQWFAKIARPSWHCISSAFDSACHWWQRTLHGLHNVIHLKCFIVKKLLQVK